MISDTFLAVAKSQQEWAMLSARSGPQSGYAKSIADNLFRGRLSSSTEEEFNKGGGGEFRAKEGELPKGLALHSSSVLVCNVFEYWRDKSLVPLTKVLKPSNAFINFRFEKKCGTGVRGGPCNLDIAFACEEDWLMGIESKFTEPFAGKRELPVVQRAYMKSGEPSSWQAIQMEGCHELAAQYLGRERGRDAGIDVRFKHLDVPQLLKHVLGLHRASQGRYRLLYLWYDPSSGEADKHRDEIADFHESSQLGAHFVSMTYQEFIPRLKEFGAPADSEYFAYLRDRYRLTG